MATDVPRRAPHAPTERTPDGDPLLSRLLTRTDGLASPVTAKRRAAKTPAELGAIWSIARKTGGPKPPR